MKRIGIDYDGTIADTSEVKAGWIREHLGMEIHPWKTDRTSCVPLIGLENYERMSLRLRAGRLSQGEGGGRFTRCH